MLAADAPVRCDEMPFTKERYVEVLSLCGMTQLEIAEESGVTQGTISQYGTGRVKDPRYSHLFRIAHAIGTTCEVFGEPVGTPIKFRRQKKKGD